MARKFSSSFYADLNALVDSYGETEFGRYDPLPAAMEIVRKHLQSPDELIVDFAKKSLDAALATRCSSSSQINMFDNEALVALGDNSFIKRGSCEFKHLLRRKSVIDTNKRDQDRAWSKETEYLSPLIKTLSDAPAGTKVRDVGYGAPALTGTVD